MSKLLEIKDLHVEYKTDSGTVYALNGVDLFVNKGETVGLVGETGAGKTTTALSVLNLLPDRVGKITKGSIVLDGLETTKAKERELRKIRGNKVSMIFQDPMTSLNPIMPVGDQIDEALLLHTTLNKKERSDMVDRMLEDVGLQPRRKFEYPHQFSGGMKQRIVIAMSLACNPELLLADEPTTALDVTIQAQVLELINALKEKYEMALLLITHDLGVVAQTCQRVAIMYAGQIIEMGTAQDIYESDIHHPYTVGLFGSIPELNIDSDRLSPIPGLMPDPMIQHKGCSFYERCPVRLDKCKSVPPTDFISGTHSIKCHYFQNDTELMGVNEGGNDD